MQNTSGVEETKNQISFQEPKAARMGDKYWDFVEVMFEVLPEDALVTVWVVFNSGNETKIPNMTKEKAYGLMLKCKEIFNED